MVCPNCIEDTVSRVCDKLDITYQLAKELLILADGNESLLIECSRKAINLSECRALIINDRIKQVEDSVYQNMMELRAAFE